MDANDPRHGTHKGLPAHRREGSDPCEACRVANRLYQRRTRKQRALYGARLVDLTGTRRRIQALHRLGWRGSDIAAAAGMHPDNVFQVANRDTAVTRMTAARIARAYNQLSMTLGPSYLTRIKSEQKGWPPPMAWDDEAIDDPAAAPRGIRSKHIDYDGRDLCDEATVLRILAGEVLPANTAERDEVVRRWRASGKPEAALCARMNWKESRYGREEKSA
jgi:hypothetical protein